MAHKVEARWRVHLQVKRPFGKPPRTGYVDVTETGEAAAKVEAIHQTRNGALGQIQPHDITILAAHLQEWKCELCPPAGAPIIVVPQFEPIIEREGNG